MSSAKNKNFQILPSAARTATTNSATFVNPHHNSVYITIDATAETATASVTPTVSGYDPISGKYFVIATFAAIEAVGTTTYLVGSKVAGAEADGAGVTSCHDLPLPRQWRLTMTAADADSLTYSVGGCYVNS